MPDNGGRAAASQLVAPVTHEFTEVAEDTDRRPRINTDEDGRVPGRENGGLAGPLRPSAGDSLRGRASNEAAGDSVFATTRRRPPPDSDPCLSAFIRGGPSL